MGHIKVWAVYMGFSTKIVHIGIQTTGMIIELCAIQKLCKRYVYYFKRLTNIDVYVSYA